MMIVIMVSVDGIMMAICDGDSAYVDDADAYDGDADDDDMIYDMIYVMI